MRRKDREVRDAEEIREMLHRSVIANIAMTDDRGLPYCVPVHFGFTLEGGALTIYFHGAKTGKKAELLRTSPRVAVSIYRDLGLIEAETACEYGASYESVMAFGQARTLESDEERKKGLDVVMRQISGKNLPYDASVLGQTAVFAVRAEKFTAKRRA